MVINMQLPVLLRAVANGTKKREIFGLTPCFVSHVLSTSGMATALKEKIKSLSSKQIDLHFLEGGCVGNCQSCFTSLLKRCLKGWGWGCKFLPFRIDPFSEGFGVQNSQTGSHKNCLLVKSVKKTKPTICIQTI